MQIHGLQKLTLLDYPGRIACTVFTGGCNFRCPFCQNAGLVLAPEKEPVIEEKELFSFLKKRQGILDGVCITGGEPTLWEKLPEFIRKIRSFGYKVKLDTNGSHPEALKMLTAEGLLDYVAMDIKNAPPKYAKTCGKETIDLDAIRSSAAFLMENKVDYEFRTTVCRELHEKEDFEQIGNWLRGCRRYFIQSYRESDHVIRPVFTSCGKEELEEFLAIMRRWIPTTELRGVD